MAPSSAMTRGPERERQDPPIDGRERSRFCLDTAGRDRGQRSPPSPAAPRPGVLRSSSRRATSGFAWALFVANPLMLGLAVIAFCLGSGRGWPSEMDWTVPALQVARLSGISLLVRVCGIILGADRTDRGDNPACLANGELGGQLADSTVIDHASSAVSVNGGPSRLSWTGAGQLVAGVIGTAGADDLIRDGSLPGEDG